MKNWGGIAWHFNEIAQGCLNLVLAELSSCPLMFLEGDKQGIMGNVIKGTFIVRLACTRNATKGFWCAELKHVT